MGRGWGRMVFASRDFFASGGAAAESLAFGMSRIRMKRVPACKGEAEERGFYSIRHGRAEQKAIPWSRADFWWCSGLCFRG